MGMMRWILVALLPSLTCGFQQPTTLSSRKSTLRKPRLLSPRVISNDNDGEESKNISLDIVWEKAALLFVWEEDLSDVSVMRRYLQAVTFLRVGVPAFVYSVVAGLVYPGFSLALAAAIDDAGVFDVVANDYSQYIQNILTTSGLTFSLLVGNTYYFLYQQQEAIYYALFEEVTVAKSLLEQVALVAQGRLGMYRDIINCMERYVREDLIRIDVEPSLLLSKKPIDDPLEQIMYMTSVGEPGVLYQTVRSLRQARAKRLGALQQKLPPLQMGLLFVLGFVVLFTFPLLGAGSQTIGGLAILKVQAWYLGFIVFGMTLVLGVIDELRDPSGQGAYNVGTVLDIMVTGLRDELKGRLDGTYTVATPLSISSSSQSPSIDIIMSQDYGDIELPFDPLLSKQPEPATEAPTPAVPIIVTEEKREQDSIAVVDELPVVDDDDDDDNEPQGDDPASVAAVVKRQDDDEDPAKVLMSSIEEMEESVIINTGSNDDNVAPTVILDDEDDDDDYDPATVVVTNRGWRRLFGSVLRRKTLEEMPPMDVILEEEEIDESAKTEIEQAETEEIKQTEMEMELEQPEAEMELEQPEAEMELEQPEAEIEQAEQPELDMAAEQAELEVLETPVPVEAEPEQTIPSPPPSMEQAEPLPKPKEEETGLLDEIESMFAKEENLPKKSSSTTATATSLPVIEKEDSVVEEEEDIKEEPPVSAAPDEQEQPPVVPGAFPAVSTVESLEKEARRFEITKQYLGDLSDKKLVFSTTIKDKELDFSVGTVVTVAIVIGGFILFEVAPPLISVWPL